MEHIIQLSHANIYQKDRLILKDVQLSVSQAEFVYLIGKTGDGKSSLLKTLWAELPLQEGGGQVAGYDLAELAKDERPYLRREIGMVFQDFRLFKDWTVENNLRFVLEATGWKNKAEIKQRIFEVLNQVQLTEKQTEPVHRLSGGEQQRIVIARAILNKPKLILADEPTGNLDPATSDQILHLLRSLAYDQNTAVLMATHDYRILESFPGRVYKVGEGRVVEME